MPPLTIFLTRHATPDWTRTDVPYHIPPGPPLTSLGEAEAGALGVFMKQAGVSMFYTSPMERCRRTAQIAAELAGVPFEILTALGEIQPGETQDSLHQRVWPVFEKARGLAEGSGPVALVTHGSPIAFLLGKLGMPTEVLNRHLVYDHRNPSPPGAAWEARQEEPGGPWELDLIFIPHPANTGTYV